jgi:CHAD domain-containing protein
VATEAPSPSALQALASTEFGGLAATLKAAAGGGSVHGARRQIKRLRSLLRLLREEIGEGAFISANESLRAMADALAGQRRAEALVVAAGRLRGKGGLYWQQAAIAHRDAHLADHAAKGGILAAQSFLSAASKAVAVPGRQPESPEAIAQAFLRSYRKARSQLARGFDSGDAAELHEARKHVIHHLHHVGILGDHLRRAGQRSEALEGLREALGDLNDLDELIQLAARVGTPPPRPAVETIARRRARLLKRAKTSAERLFRHAPKAFRKRIGAMWPAVTG